jgi:hypothetical protein
MSHVCYLEIIIPAVERMHKNDNTTGRAPVQIKETFDEHKRRDHEDDTDKARRAFSWCFAHRLFALECNPIGSS